jgi:hypothetical protein
MSVRSKLLLLGFAVMVAFVALTVAVVGFIQASTAQAQELSIGDSTTPTAQARPQQAQLETATTQQFGTAQDCRYDGPTYDGYICSPSGQVSFSATESGDTSCSWNATVSWGDGTSTPYQYESGATFTHSYTEANVYTVQITGSGSSPNENTTCTFHPATFIVEVPAPNQPPDGSFSYTIDSDDPLLVHFVGSGTDPEGGPLKYAWRFGDNFSTTCLDSPTADHRYGSYGKYTVTLIVCDDRGNTDPTPATKTITLKRNASSGGGGGGGPGGGGGGGGPGGGPGGGGGGPGGPGGGSFYHSELGPPTIYDVRTEDPDSNGQASALDIMRFVFNESMDKSTGAKGSSFRVSDADGTTADITCGTATRCDLLAGAGTVAGVSVKYDQVMFVRLLKTPQQSDMVDPGATPGLQYPLTIIEVNSHFKDRGGAGLDLAGSGDKSIEVVPSVLDFVT